jgi:hypothetical protein
MLAEYNSNEKVEDIIKSIKDKKVQYGIMRWRGEWDSEITLRLAEVGVVSNVKTGTIITR